MAEGSALIRLGELCSYDEFTRDGVSYSCTGNIKTDGSGSVEAYSSDLNATRMFSMRENVVVTFELRDKRHKCSFMGKPRMCSYGYCHKTPEPSWADKLRKALAQ
jgi:hypothetical protein